VIEASDRVRLFGVANIGATTVVTGGDWSPTFRLGDQQCIGPPPNFLAVVFKKQEIHSKDAIQCSLQSLFIMDQDDLLHAIYVFHNFHLIGFCF